MLRRYRMVISTLLLAWVVTGCTLSGGTVEEALPQISGEPVARITAPLPNATYLEGVGVNIQIAVTNAGTDIDRVEVSLDGVVAATLPDPNPSDAPAFGVTQTFSAEGIGAHIVEARVFRLDGSVSQPVTVTYNIIAEIIPSDPTPTPTNTVPPTLAATAITPSLTPQATADSAVQPAATTATTADGSVVISTNAVATAAATTAGVTPDVSPTSSTPLALFEGAVNVRRGPSTNFEPPLGAFNAGQSAEVLALNTDATWLKVRFAGGEGWVFRQIIKTEGPVDSLPREAGPPVPTLAPVTVATSVPAGATTAATTAPSTGGPNLIVVGFELRQNAGTTNVNDISINQPSTAFVRVRNAGDQTAGGFFAVLTIVNTSDGGFKLVEAGAVNELAAGAETLVQIAFTDMAGQNLSKTAVVRVDENNQIVEINENDNASAPITYTLK